MNSIRHHHLLALLLIGPAVLVGCASDAAFEKQPQTDEFAAIQEKYGFTDTGSDSPIPPSARARRADDPQGNRLGLPQEPVDPVPDQIGFGPSYAPEYYASNQTRTQVEGEIGDEFQRRKQAFGYRPRGEPRALDLGAGPELTPISARTQPQPEQRVVYAYPDEGGFARSQAGTREEIGAGNYQQAPAGAPPLPDNARTGDCYTLVKQPAQYQTVSREVQEPVRYRTVNERVLEQPERTVWSSDCGALERPANATGETACLVRQPATYRNVQREVPIGGGTRTVTERVRVGEPAYEWREILCRASLDESLVRNLQRSLRRAGYNPGPIDGVFGPRTRSAVNAYQRAQGLPVDDRLNMITLRDLGLVSR